MLARTPNPPTTTKEASKKDRPRTISLVVFDMCNSLVGENSHTFYSNFDAGLTIRKQENRLSPAKLPVSGYSLDVRRRRTVSRKRGIDVQAEQELLVGAISSGLLVTRCASEEEFLGERIRNLQVAESSFMLHVFGVKDATFSFDCRRYYQRVIPRKTVLFVQTKRLSIKCLGRMNCQ